MRLQINPNALATFHKIGDCKTSVLVVDNFLANPDEIREMALTLSYSTPQRVVYPGYNASINLCGLKEMHTWIMERMAEHFFPQSIPNHILLNNFKKRITVFATLACDKSKLPYPFFDQHIDADPSIWLASVLHFSLHPEARGTGFWKNIALESEHLSTIQDPPFLLRLEEDFGLTFTKPLLKLIKKGSLLTMEDLFPFLFSDSQSEPFSRQSGEKWKLMHFVEAKFNRLVVYPAWLFHSIIDESQFKELTLDNMRLTMNTFHGVPYDLNKPIKIGLDYDFIPYSYDFYRPIKGLAIEDDVFDLKISSRGSRTE